MTFTNDSTVIFLRKSPHFPTVVFCFWALSSNHLNKEIHNKSGPLQIWVVFIVYIREEHVPTETLVVAAGSLSVPPCICRGQCCGIPLCDSAVGESVETGRITHPISKLNRVKQSAPPPPVVAAKGLVFQNFCTEQRNMQMVTCGEVDMEAN